MTFADHNPKAADIHMIQVLSNVFLILNSSFFVIDIVVGW